MGTINEIKNMEKKMKQNEKSTNNWLWSKRIWLRILRIIKSMIEMVKIKMNKTAPKMYITIIANIPNILIRKWSSIS